MATITAQLLIGEAHTWHGGIMNATTINLYENSRPAWVYEPADRKEENIYWVPTVENMLEDGLLLVAVHIWRNDDIIRTLKATVGNDNLKQLELYNLPKEDRDILYEKCRVLSNGGKVILSVFSGSTLLGQAGIMERYQVEHEICLPQTSRQQNYIWYACYGSNLCKERFLWYIRGGGPKNNQGCQDKTLPVVDRPYTIHHELYFANQSRTWGNGGVAFLKLEKDEKIETLGRAYLITAEQFEDVKKQEGASSNWYGHVLELGEMAGIPIKTLTRVPENTGQYVPNTPSLEYLDMLRRGLWETYPSMTVEEISRYLDNILYTS